MSGPKAADNLKYSLRSLLELARVNCVSDLPQPSIPQIETSYAMCRHALVAADSYESARLAFGCFWKGRASYERVEGKHLFTSLMCARYEMLDRLVPEHDRAISTEDDPVAWLEQTIIHDGAIDQSGSRISYRFRESVAKRLAKSLPESRPFLPPEWRAWGVPAAEARRVLRALRLRCVYHCFAIDTLASHFRVVGGGLDDLLLRMEWSHLVSQVAKLAAAPTDQVESVLSALRFGHLTTNPDPALQPIIPVGPTEVALPCRTIATSNVERNLLVLQARLSKQDFDSQSHLFARDMTRDLEAAMDRLGLPYKSSVATDAGETDLVFSLPDGDVVFVVELKWFIPPGDLRETIERTVAVRAGVEQVQCKLRSLRQDRRAEELLGLAHPPTAYAALVVTEGFSTASGDPAVACLPASVFKRLLEVSSSGEDAAKKLTEQPWLPCEGVHYQRASREHSIADVSFSWCYHTLLPAADDLAKQWVGPRSTPPPTHRGVPP